MAAFSLKAVGNIFAGNTSEPITLDATSNGDVTVVSGLFHGRNPRVDDSAGRTYVEIKPRRWWHIWRWCTPWLAHRWTFVAVAIPTPVSPNICATDDKGRCEIEVLEFSGSPP